MSLYDIFYNVGNFALHNPWTAIALMVIAGICFGFILAPFFLCWTGRITFASGKSWLKSRLPSAVDILDRKCQFQFWLIRKNNYDPFPMLLNKIIEVICDNDIIKDSWIKMYDSIIHLHELYHIQWQSDVCSLLFNFNIFSSIIFI